MAGRLAQWENSLPGMATLVWWQASTARSLHRLASQPAIDMLTALYLHTLAAFHMCRAEIEAQEAVIDQLERRLADAERRAGDASARATAAEAAAAEKEGMIAWVGEEVERVKALFDQKVGRVVAAAELAGRRSCNNGASGACPRLLSFAHDACLPLGQPALLCTSPAFCLLTTNPALCLPTSPTGGALDHRPRCGAGSCR